MTRVATVLIVDDEDRNRRLLEMLLQPEGYVTITATSGREALAAVANNAIDLVLLDVMMPGMDGYEVARVLKADPLTQSIPIIMVTAHVDRQTRLRALESGVEEFLTKPVNRAELWLRVRNLLRLKEYGNFLADYNSVLELRVGERTLELQRFRVAMDATADGIFLTHAASMAFVEVNATACRMLGYTRDELLASSPAHLSVPTVVDLPRDFDAIIAGDLTRALVTSSVRRKDGTTFPAEIHRHAYESTDGWIIVDVLHDITAQVAADERLQQMAHYDALTGLPNRTLFYETLAKTLTMATRNEWRVAVMFLDLDNFKSVNDTLGHATGDSLLAAVSDRLVECVHVRDTVGRLGGDEFALILTMNNDELGAATVARRIRAALREPFDLAGNRVPVTASIGITMFPSDASAPETLIKYADTAMYNAKQAGRDTFRFFKRKMNDDVVARLQLEQSLQAAIDNSEFVLHYQPKVHLDTGAIVGLEALLRWERPGHGLVPPNAFIPALEETGLIREVGAWVIDEACRQIAEWSRNDVGATRVAVNVSSRQFLDSDLDGVIGDALLKHGISPEALELEITESSLMANTERTVATLHQLKARGVQLSIDDFGTGFSCLAYLRQFPIDKLKIDIAFVRNVTNSPADSAIAETIIRLGHSLHMEVIAEGVETAAQLAYFTDADCDEVQGYYFSRPLAVVDLEKLLRADTRLNPAPLSQTSSRTTVLIVDHTVETLVALESVLQTDGHRILTARSAADALELLASHHVDVVVSDADMWFVDGTNFLEGIQAMFPAIARIALSESKDIETVMHAVNRGGLHGFHGKPWDGEALRATVRTGSRGHMVPEARSRKARLAPVEISR